MNLKQSMKTGFFQNVVALSLGAAGANALSFLFSPIITRIYSPEAIGVLGAFIAITAVLAPIVALSYPSAIVLPKRDNDAVGLVVISVILSVSFAAVLTLGVSLSQAFGLDFGLFANLGLMLFWVPLALVAGAVQDFSKQWLIRKQSFSYLAKVSIIYAIMLNVLKVVVGLWIPDGESLIYTTLFSAVVLIGFLSIGSKVSIFRQFPQVSILSKSLKEVSRRYRDFPIYRAPQICLHGAAQSLPILILAGSFNPALAGFYAIARSSLMVPVNVLGQSVYDVFFPYISKALQDGYDVYHSVFKITATLAVTGIIPFLVIVVYGPQGFAFVFGENWETAGTYGRWLAIMLFFGFISRPCIAVIPALKMQKFLFYYELFSVVILALAFYLPVHFHSDDVLAVAIYAMVGSLAQIFVLVMVLRKCREVDKTSTGENANSQL